MINQWVVHRVSAGVLSYVLSIGIVVSMGLSMLIFYIYYSRLEYKWYERQVKITRNLNSAMQLTLGSPKSFEYNQEYSYDLYGNGTDSIIINRYAWGLLDLFHVTAFTLSDTVSKWYHQAYTRGEVAYGALYLVDDGRPLSVVGNTRLEGICYLPASGIQSAYINRVGYRNEELVYGEQLESEDLPEFALDDKFSPLTSISGNFGDLSGDTIRNSFSNQTLVISQPADTLSNVFIGNIVIKSTNKIVFDSLASTMDGVLVVASSIELGEGFKGSGQFLATDTIIVGKGAKLEYPCILACYNETDLATIYMNEESEVNGWLMIDGMENGFRRRVIYVEDGAVINGLVYCNGLLETYGEINGHVTTKRFLVNNQVGVYENYLLNSQITGGVLDSAFLTFDGWFATEEGQILEYLY